MAEVSGAAPATHKQPSRKGKKAWRKNVDLTQVQQGLENVRDETIQGGVIAEKEAADLFAIDVAGDAEIDRKVKSSGKKLLKADEILAQRSAVPGLEGRKRKAEPIIEKSSKKARDGKYISQKELERLRSIADNATGGVAIVEPAASHDPWGAPPPPQHPELNFLEEKKPAKEPKTLRHAPVSLAASGKPFPNVRKPEASKSYNPLVHDWTALLEREGAAAVAAEQARLAAEAEEAAQLARNEAVARQVEAEEKDGWATDYDSAWESEFEGFQSEGEQREYSQKQPRRKTPAERNKIKARREREQREKWEKKQKERDAQEARIKAIAKESSAKDRARKSLAVKPAAQSSEESDDGAEPALAKRRFGKKEVPAAPLEVVLPDELQDSLRRLKPEGNLLTDRYRNLLLNGKVEVRKRQGQHKKRRVENTEKWSYKDWKLK